MNKENRVFSAPKGKFRINLSRCFIVADTNVDTSSASKFGEVVVLFPYFNRRCIYAKDFEQTCIETLISRDFDPQLDYIVLSGDLTANCRLIAGLVCSNLVENQLNVLSWDKTKFEYKDLVLDLIPRGKYHEE